MERSLKGGRVSRFRAGVSNLLGIVIIILLGIILWELVKGRIF